MKREPQWRFADAPGQELKVEMPKGIALGLPCSRAFDRYQSAPEELDGILADTVQAVVEVYTASVDPIDPLAKYSKASPFIFPNVISKGSAQQSGGPLIRKFTPHLEIMYYYDPPDTSYRIWITKKIAKDWKVTPEQIHQRAVANLGILEKWTISTERTKGVTWYAVHPGDDYGASRVLLAPLLDEIARQAGGDLAVWIPARQICLAARFSQKEVVEGMGRVAHTVYAKSVEPISDRTFRYRVQIHKLEETENSVQPAPTKSRPPQSPQHPQ